MPRTDKKYWQAVTCSQIQPFTYICSHLYMPLKYYLTTSIIYFCGCDTKLLWETRLNQKVERAKEKDEILTPPGRLELPIDCRFEKYDA
jgi:hypothetical protein